MTDDTTPTPAGEEPTDPKTPEAQKPAVDEQPTAQLKPDVAEEQTIITDTPIVDEQATVTMATEADEEATLPAAEAEATQVMAKEAPVDAEATQITPGQGFAAAPTVQATPQPAQAYERFNAETEAVQATPYGDVAPATPFNAETPTGAPAPLYAEGPYPYTPYPTQPGMPVPPVARRRSPVLWIALAVVLILLVGGGIIFALIASRAPTNTPTQVLQQFCHGFTTFNAQEIYNTYSSASQGGTSVAQLQHSLDGIKNLSQFVTIKSCTVSDVHQNSSTATGKITITETVSILGYSSTVPVTESMALVLENNSWKIDIAHSGSPNTIPTIPPVPTTTSS